MDSNRTQVFDVGPKGSIIIGTPVFRPSRFAANFPRPALFLSPTSICRRCRDSSSSLLCAADFLKSRWLRSAALTSPADQVPGGVTADAFYAKGQHHAELLRNVAELIRTTEARAMNHHRQSAPVWIPRNGKDSNGVPFIVLTCTECLRSFPLSVMREEVQEIQETPCLFCTTPVRYIIDFSRAVASPKDHAAGAASGEQSSAKP